MAKKKKTQAEAETPVEAAASQVVEELDSITETAALLQEIDHLKLQLEEARQKADENYSGWQRALADFANLKRRVEREQAQANQAAASSIIKRYLDVVDDLDRALKNRPQEGDGANWANGVDLIYRKLMGILDAEGVKPIQAEGQDFDPNMHEAISMEESSAHPSGQVIGIVQQGYTLGERVLRPARVRVAR